MTKQRRLMLATAGLLALLAACQSTPPTPEPGKEFPPPEQDAGDESLKTFNPDEIVIGTDDDTNTFSYLKPKIYTSPLSIRNNLWDRVRRNFQLDYNHQTPRIDVQLQWFVNNQDYLDRVNLRASRYLWYITEELEKRHMPGEIALLPIVESAYDPFAYSHGRASGMWQFITPTARLMGLKQDWWYDGRRDVIASTNASLDLLQRLHDDLNNDWLLALAAYNSGEGNVLKAIHKNKRRHKPLDFWSLDLPLETRAYAPKLLALARIYNDPKKYNVYIMPIRNESYFDVVETGSQIDLAQAAKLADIEMDELYLLNPAFNRWATNPAGPHQLLVPKENAELFRRALAEFPPEKRVTWERYTVKHGDSLGSVARHYNTTTQQLASVNKLNPGTAVRPGETLMIPVASSASYSLSKTERIARIQNTPPGNNNSLRKITYLVKDGDTFWSISQEYDVDMRSLAKWNGLAVRDPLHTGDELVIWINEEADAAEDSTTGEDNADADTGAGEADTSSEDSGNEVTDTETTGSEDTSEDTNSKDSSADTADNGPETGEDDILNATLPDQLDAHPENKIRKISYRAHRGDSVSKVAKKFNVSSADLMRWNNLKKNQKIRRGKILVIYVDVTDTR